jgi:hypothetical protein
LFSRAALGTAGANCTIDLGGNPRASGLGPDSDYCGPVSAGVAETTRYLGCSTRPA